MASGGVAESVDARDLKSFGMKILWGFKSPRPHPSRRAGIGAHIPIFAMATSEATIEGVNRGFSSFWGSERDPDLLIPTSQVNRPSQRLASMKEHRGFSRVKFS